MFRLDLVPSSEIPKELLERLWTEVYPYANSEIQRIGEEKLKSTLFDLQDCIVAKYIRNEYVVGIASTYIKRFEDKNYLFYRFQLLGCDETGSRSWFYSEEHVEAIATLLKNQNLSGLIFVQNPNDQGSKAANIYLGSHNKHLKTVRFVEQQEVKLLLTDNTLKIAVFDLL
jgi:hypothetical protein